MHPAIASRVVRRALACRAGDRFIGFDHVQRFLEFVTTGHPGDAMSFPGQQVRLRASRAGETGELVATLGPEPPRGVAEVAATLLAFPLSIPGEVVLSAQRLAIGADFAPGARRGSDEGQTPSAKATGVEGGGPGSEPGDAERREIAGARLPLSVRFRKPGDRFSPPGMGGQSRKLQDYLVDRKVPRAERDQLPLVVDGDDRIVWIVGHAVAEDFRVTAPSRGVIILKVRRLGGEG